MAYLQPSASSAATLSSDDRKVASDCEITLVAVMLLVAVPGGYVAMLAGIPLRQIPQLSLGSHCAHEIGAS